MLCSNPGTIRMDQGTAVVQMEKADHQLFLSQQSVKDHKDWLIGMKKRFVKMRKSLKPITIGYLKDGRWIKPRNKTQDAPIDKDDQS